MADYNSILKLDSFPSVEVDLAYYPGLSLDGFPIFEVIGTFNPVVTISYFVDDRPKNGQINPRRL